MRFKVNRTYKHKNGGLVYVLGEGTPPSANLYFSLSTSPTWFLGIGKSSEERERLKAQEKEQLLRYEEKAIEIVEKEKGQWLVVRFPTGNIETINVRELEKPIKTIKEQDERD